VKVRHFVKKGSQASPARPSDRIGVKIEKLAWWKTIEAFGLIFLQPK
jgi:hypothetical protein